jgi:hypothetical protein
MHHLLLHLTEGEIANANDQAPATDNSKRQTVSNAFFAIGSAIITNVQIARVEVPRTFNILLATDVDFHTAEGCCVKVRALLDQGSTFSFISESLCQILSDE